MASFRPIASAAVALGMAILVVISTGAPDTPSFGVIMGGGPILAGRLLDTSGSPAGNVAVTVSRQDYAGSDADSAILVETPVGSAVTDVSGYFTVDASAISPADSYEMTGVVDGQEVVYDFQPDTTDAGDASSMSKTLPGGRPTIMPTVAVIQAGKGPLINPYGAPRDLGTSETRLLGRAATHDVAADSDPGDSVLVAPPAGFEPDPNTTATSTTEDASPPAGFNEVQSADGRAPTKCANYIAWSHIPHSHFAKYLPVRAVVTKDHSRQEYIYRTANETRSGGVLTVAGENSKLGMTGSGSDSVGESLDWTPAKLDNNTDWSLWVEWDYEKWQAWCPAPVPGGVIKMAVTKSLPWAVAGGSTHRAGPTPDQFPCTVQHRLDAGYKLDRAHTERWGGWFQIAGIKLDTETTQSADTLTRVIPDNNTAGNDEQDPKYCSSGSLMRDSAWVAEVR